MEERLKIKTTEELHEMTVDDIRDYKRRIYSHCADISAIIDYRERIGDPKMLNYFVKTEEQIDEPEVADFEVEEE